MLIFRYFLFFIVAAVLVAGPIQQQNAHADQQAISMDFKNVDIHVLIKFISELTGRNFIVDRRVAGRVTAYSPTKLSISEAYKVFESILLVNNFAIVATTVDDEYKILPTVEARRMGLSVKTGRSVSNDLGEELITQIIPLKNSSAPELAKLLGNMIDKHGLVSVYNPTNTLIITAPASNIDSILSVIHEVDKSAYAPQMETIALEHGDSKTIAASVSKIMTTKIKELEKVGKKAIALIEPDLRTNSVVVLADPKSLSTVKAMVEALDIPTPQGKDDIHFVNLENADAEDVAKILNDLISRQLDKEGKAQKLSKDIKVVADKATNSLIITARPDEFNTLKSTIRNLDKLRQQVYIEALVMEVSSSAQFNFGVNWAAGGSGGDTSVFGAANNGGGVISLPDEGPRVAGFPAGGSIGAVLSEAIKVGQSTYSIQAIVSAIETNNDYKIIATPQLLTLDNEKASVSVVDNIPYSKQTETSNVNQDYNSQSIDYKDVGFKLEVTPHIGEEGTLRLELKQEVSRLISDTISVNEDGTKIIAPTTKKREVETVIQMKDNQTAVIAGLINDDQSNNKGNVPGMGDIPLFGWLFKQKKEQKSSTNLFLFITPRVIRSYDEATSLAWKKRKSLHEVSLEIDGTGAPKMVLMKPIRPIFQYPQSADPSESDLIQ